MQRKMFYGRSASAIGHQAATTQSIDNRFCFIAALRPDVTRALVARAYAGIAAAVTYDDGGAVCVTAPAGTPYDALLTANDIVAADPNATQPIAVPAWRTIIGNRGPRVVELDLGAITTRALSTDIGGEEETIALDDEFKLQAVAMFVKAGGAEAVARGDALFGDNFWTSYARAFDDPLAAELGDRLNLAPLVAELASVPYYEDGDDGERYDVVVDGRRYETDGRTLFDVDVVREGPRRGSLSLLGPQTLVVNTADAAGLRVALYRAELVRGAQWAWKWREVARLEDADVVWRYALINFEASPFEEEEEAMIAEDVAAATAQARDDDEEEDDDRALVMDDIDETSAAAPTEVLAPVDEERDPRVERAMDCVTDACQLEPQDAAREAARDAAVAGLADVELVAVKAYVAAYDEIESDRPDFTRLTDAEHDLPLTHVLPDAEQWRIIRRARVSQFARVENMARVTDRVLGEAMHVLRAQYGGGTMPAARVDAYLALDAYARHRGV
jgi:hypothetical protein